MQNSNQLLLAGYSSNALSYDTYNHLRMFRTLARQHSFLSLRGRVSRGIPDKKIPTRFQSIYDCGD